MFNHIHLISCVVHREEVTRTSSCKNLCSANSSEGRRLVPCTGKIRDVSTFMVWNQRLSLCLVLQFFLFSIVFRTTGEYRIKQPIFLIGRVKRERVIIRFSVHFFQSSDVVCECKSNLTSRVMTRWSGYVRCFVVVSPKAVYWIPPNLVSDQVRVVDLFSSLHCRVICCSVDSQFTMTS